MSELPENLDDWPSDPSEIFGLPLGSSASDLRKRYSQLIRKHKPEQYPHHFRRIREAYEFLLRFEDMPISLQQDAPCSPSQDGEPINEDLNASDRTRLPAAPPNPWTIARKGDPVSAYQKFRGLPNPSAHEYLQMYWLLALYPELDPGRLPATYLFNAVRLGGFVWPQSVLLTREFIEQPDLALREEADQLVSHIECYMHVSFLRERWRAAEWIDRSGVIALDLVALKPLFGNARREAWLQVLLCASHVMIWSCSEMATFCLRWCQKEMDELADIHLSLGWQFDHFESEQIAAEVFQELRQRWNSSEFAGLIEVFRTDQLRPPEEVRACMMRIFSGLTDRIDQLYRLLTDISDPLLLQLQRLLTGQLLAAEPAEDRSALVGDFARRTRWEKRSAFPRALEFCIHQRVDPETVADALKKAGLKEAAHTLRESLAVRCLYLGSLMFFP